MQHRIPNKLHLCNLSSCLKKMQPRSFTLTSNSLNIAVNIYSLPYGAFEKVFQQESVSMRKLLQKRHWKILKKYELELNGHPSKEHFALIFSQFQVMPKIIRHLSLSISISQNQHKGREQSLDLCFRIMNELTNIKSISFNFNIENCTIETQERIIKVILTKCVKIQHKLERFSLCVPELAKLERFEKRNPIIAKFLRSLQRIDLKFPMTIDPKISSEEIIKSISGRGKRFIINLPGIQLNLSSSTYDTDRLVKGLLWQIGSKKPSNQHFDLNIYSCWELSKKFLETLAEHLSLSLRSLILTCGNSLLIDDKGIQSFASQMGSKLKSLEYLELNFITCINATDKSVESLAIQTAQNLPKLKDFRLRFSNCGKITDESLECFASEIKNNGFRSLKELELYLYSRKTIAFNGLKAFLNSIGANLTHLQNLIIAFPNCMKIISADVTMLITEIQGNLNKLNRFSLKIEKETIKIEDGRMSQLIFK